MVFSVQGNVGRGSPISPRMASGSIDCRLSFLSKTGEAKVSLRRGGPLKGVHSQPGRSPKQGQRKNLSPGPKGFACRGFSCMALCLKQNLCLVEAGEAGKCVRPPSPKRWWFLEMWELMTRLIPQGSMQDLHTQTFVQGGLRKAPPVNKP